MPTRYSRILNPGLGRHGKTWPSKTPELMNQEIACFNWVLHWERSLIGITTLDAGFQVQLTSEQMLLQGCILALHVAQVPNNRCNGLGRQPGGWVRAGKAMRCGREAQALGPVDESDRSVCTLEM